jgi:hypothetical protein
MNASDIFEIASSIILLIVGAWGTAYAYGLVGERLVGGYCWNPKFRQPMRWLGPLLVIFCVASLFVIIR